MNLPELSIRRHVLAFMLNGIFIVFGLVAYNRIGLDRYPNIDIPVVNVTTIQPGANPEIIDASITNIIEKQVNSVSGIDSIQSQSLPGVSIVTVMFELSKDVDVAFNEVQAKVNQVLPDLPDDAEQPVVAKFETGAAPIIWINITGDRTLQQLNLYAKNVIKKRLENVNGVGEVTLGGERERTIRLNIDTEALAGYHLTAVDLVQAIGAQHLRLPGGYITGDGKESLLKLDIEYHSTDALTNLVIGYQDGRSIKLGDVAQIEDALDDYRELALFRGENDTAAADGSLGKPTVSLGVVKIAGTNAVAIIDEVKRRLDEEIRPELPAGIDVEISYDESGIILELVHALMEHLSIGTLLTAFVVLFFLRNIRATIIVALSIPVSLLGAVAGMYFLGYTFNSLTLLALLLLIGVVVDDAIVVLENIYRHRETIDNNRFISAMHGTNEVVFAVLAATLSLVAIFLPVAFMGGIVGRFFSSFGVVVVVGVLISWFVSLSMTPMMCSRYLTISEKHGKLYNSIEAFLAGMEKIYARFIERAIRFRWLVILLAVVSLFPGAFFMKHIGTEFIPMEDVGVFTINYKTPLGSSIDYTSAKLQEVAKVLEQDSAVSSYLAMIGEGDTGRTNEGYFDVNLLPRTERKEHQNEIIQRIQAQLNAIPGMEAFVSEKDSFGSGRGEPVQFCVRGPSINTVAEIADTIETRLRSSGVMSSVDMTLDMDMPQTILQIDRDRAAEIGLTAQEVAMSANILGGGYDVARYNDDPGDGERYDIRIKARDGQIDKPIDLSSIYLRAKDGSMVRLDTIAEFVQEIGPASIPRYDLQYAANFYCQPFVAEGESRKLIEQICDDVLPMGYSLSYMGRSNEMSKTVNYMITTFILATVLLYMVLASQFNSFVQPLIIMVAQPLAIVGALGGLFFFGHTLNLYSMIGIILLIGLVAKNSILLVDFTNQKRREGMKISEALVNACPLRMRPVLMTSLTVILTMLPAALGIGAGADSNGPLAACIIGGMIWSTVLTLVVIPSVYSVVEGWLSRHTHKSVLQEQLEEWERRHPVANQY
ncbi:MAG: efflux RND transporter permease subunit [Opitutales bacterium]|nr:efflux RND transporter permease subunit [Opitutales bacterium]